MLHLLQKVTSEMRLSLFGIELPFHFSLLELSFLLHLGFSWEPQSTNSVSFFPAHSSTHSSTLHNNHPSANAAPPLHPSLQTFYLLSFSFQPPPLPALLPHPLLSLLLTRSGFSNGTQAQIPDALNFFTLFRLILVNFICIQECNLCPSSSFQSRSGSLV